MSLFKTEVNLKRKTKSIFDIFKSKKAQVSDTPIIFGLCVFSGVCLVFLTFLANWIGASENEKIGVTTTSQTFLSLTIPNIITGIKIFPFATLIFFLPLGITITYIVLKLIRGI